MRILISFIAGLLLSFYLSELASTISRKTKLNRILKINHSIIGVIAIIFGIFNLAFSGANAIQALISFFAIGAGLGMIAHHLMSKHYIFFKSWEQAFATKHEAGFERFFEIMPGAMTWTALLSPIWLSFILPFAVAYIIIIADIYWLINSVRLGFLIYLGYKKTEYAKKQDWLQKLKEDYPKEWQQVYHLFVLPSFNESLEVLQPAFNAVVNSNYPKEKIFFGVGFEQRMQQKDPEGMKQKVEAVKQLASKIGGAFATIHPLGLSGEIPGPATNRNWIINNAVKELKKRGIKPEQVLVTTLDADFVVHPQFLAGALYKYLSTPENERYKRSYTGVFFYHNNYWQAPAPMRLMANGTTLWQMAEMVGSDKYINFSSLSMNLKSLLDVGLWIPNKVNDDSGFYWKAYYHFKGDYKVIPHFLPISGDTVLDVNLSKTFHNQYQQYKRWAYGVEHMPFIIMQYFRDDSSDFWNKTDKVLFKIWGDFKWGTLALFVTFAGLLIPVINPGYSQSAVAYNLPIVSSWILTGAFLGLFSSIYVHEKTAPKRPANWSILQRVWSYLQWLLTPLVLITITAIPVIHAQTALMLGRYIEYRTTNKARLSATKS